MTEAKTQEPKGRPREIRRHHFIERDTLHNGTLLARGWRQAFNADARDVFLYLPASLRCQSVVHAREGKVFTKREGEMKAQPTAQAGSFRPMAEGEAPQATVFAWTTAYWRYREIVFLTYCPAASRAVRQPDWPFI